MRYIIINRALGVLKQRIGALEKYPRILVLILCLSHKLPHEYLTTNSLALLLKT